MGPSYHRCWLRLHLNLLVLSAHLDFLFQVAVLRCLRTWSIQNLLIFSRFIWHFELLGNSLVLQCTARFQVRLSVDSFILKLPIHRAPLLMPAGRAGHCGQCRAWCDRFNGYHIFLELALCRRFFTLTACLFTSMDHPSGQDLCHLLC